MSTTLASSSSVGIFSFIHHSCMSAVMLSRFSSSSSFSISSGMLSGPGTFLLLSFLMTACISSLFGGCVLYLSFGVSSTR